MQRVLHSKLCDHFIGFKDRFLQKSWFSTSLLHNPTHTTLTQREDQITNLSLCEALEWLSTRKTTAVELTEASIKQMKETAHLNVFTNKMEDYALEVASLSDKRRSSGHLIRKLEGVPIAVKDNFCVHNIPTTAGSKMLSNYLSPYNATVVSQLLQAGAVIVGKTNMDEFSMGSESTTGAIGPVINPWNSLNGQYVAGGSSGGSAAAVSARACYGAIGSDTGGSVRLPAAYCGVVGLKPSYGRVSRWGLVAYASSLDTPGILARSVPDAAKILEAISGSDTHDSTTIPEPPLAQLLSGTNKKSLEGVGIGIPREYHVKELSQDIVRIWERAAKQLQEAGASVFEVSLPHTPYALMAYYILATAEAASNLFKYDGVRFGSTVYKNIEELYNITNNDLYISTRTTGFGEEVKRRIILGTHVLSRDSYESYYRKAQQIRRLVLEDFTSVFNQKIDFLLTPTAPHAAYSINSSLGSPHVYTQDIMTVPASMAGLPAMSLPVCLDAKWILQQQMQCANPIFLFIQLYSGLPLGIQLIAPSHSDAALISAADAIAPLINQQMN